MKTEWTKGYDFGYKEGYSDTRWNIARYAIAVIIVATAFYLITGV